MGQISIRMRRKHQSDREVLHVFWIPVWNFHLCNSLYCNLPTKQNMMHYILRFGHDTPNTQSIELTPMTSLYFYSIFVEYFINCNFNIILTALSIDGFQPNTSPFSTHHLIWVNYEVLSRISQPMSILFSYLNNARRNSFIELCRKQNFNYFYGSREK